MQESYENADAMSTCSKSIGYLRHIPSGQLQASALEYDCVLGLALSANLSFLALSANGIFGLALSANGMSCFLQTMQRDLASLCQQALEAPCCFCTDAGENF